MKTNVDWHVQWHESKDCSRRQQQQQPHEKKTTHWHAQIINHTIEYCKHTFALGHKYFCRLQTRIDAHNESNLKHSPVKWHTAKYARIGRKKNRTI